MTITIEPELEKTLVEAARRSGTTPEALAVQALREHFTASLGPAPGRQAALPIVPRDEWEERLLAIGTDCGVSLSNEDVSRETMYD